MQPPIFYDDNGDLSIFNSIESAELYLEPESMDHPGTRIYDSHGRVLGQKLLPNSDWLTAQLGMPGRQIGLFELEHEPTHASELEIKLRAFLKLVDSSNEQFDSESLGRLVELCVSHAQGF